MSSEPRHALDHPEVAFLVCESGQRWCDTARRFVGPFQHAEDQRPSGASAQPSIIVRNVPHQKVRASLASNSDAAVLWEISAENVVQVALSVAQIAVGRPDVMQLVGLHSEAGRAGSSIGLRMLELGVRAVVSSPEEFAIISSLVHRRFQSTLPRLS